VLNFLSRNVEEIPSI